MSWLLKAAMRRRELEQELALRSAIPVQLVDCRAKCGSRVRDHGGQVYCFNCRKKRGEL